MKKITFFSLLALNLSLAQAPNITYNNPNDFTIGQAVAPLLPSNTGGAVTVGTYVSTFAGSGNVGSADGLGTVAGFNLPTVVTIDNSGILYVVDRSNHKIRKITPEGEVSTFAGSGFSGSADGLGTAASFRYPDGAVADSNGNLFVTDQSNHKIRKITPDGNVATFAGTGSIGAVDAVGTDASFYYPAGMAVDASDNLYIADYGNNKIRKITPDAVVTTYAGTGVAGSADGPALEAQFNGATGVAVDPDGNVFVADYYNHLIRKISFDGNVTTIAGSGAEGFADGNGTLAVFDHPAIVAIDNAENLFITDEENNKIRKITPDGQVTTLAGTGTVGATDGEASTAEFNSPTGVVADTSGHVFVCDYGNNKIRKIGDYGYSISPALPDGLVFDTETGIISGMPTTISATADYTVTASNPDGTSSFAVTITVSGALQNPDFAAASVRLYPNPIKDLMNIEALEDIQTITLLNLVGQKILTRNIGNKNAAVDLSGIPSGFYFVRLALPSTTQAIRIVKK